MKKLAVALLVLSALGASAAEARWKGREPCSGKKGGISHCSGSKFVCNDGSISKSKRSCGGGAELDASDFSGADAVGGGHSSHRKASHRRRR